MVDEIIILILGAMLLCCAIQDLRNKKVTLWVLIIGAVLTVGCLPFAHNLSIAGRIGGLAVGLAVVLLSKVTEGKIGMGDGILLCISGLSLGFWCNLELFGIALLLAAMLSILLLILRRVNRKQSIPFVPFLFVGYLILFVASNGSMT
ncbi:MAG: putative rane protein [Herbinix sp.]|jgi:leader peptidase (prepilin peptidase)/N-methyltransferase|nr:putative rane protein [Herbinix sp.]